MKTVNQIIASIVFSVLSYAEGVRLDEAMELFEQKSYEEIESLIIPSKGVTFEELEFYFGEPEKLKMRGGGDYYVFNLFSEIHLEVLLSKNMEVDKCNLNYRGGISDYSSTAIKYLALMENPESNRREETKSWFKKGYLHTIENWALFEKKIPSWMQKKIDVKHLNKLKKK
ncbi:MAG: hypothetical protein ACSHX0_02480 [Akkermansiaceae bacterium]